VRGGGNKASPEPAMPESAAADPTRLGAFCGFRSRAHEHSSTRDRTAMPWARADDDRQPWQQAADRAWRFARTGETLGASSAAGRLKGIPGKHFLNYSTNSRWRSGRTVDCRSRGGGNRHMTWHRWRRREWARRRSFAADAHDCLMSDPKRTYALQDPMQVGRQLANVDVPTTE